MNVAVAMDVKVVKLDYRLCIAFITCKSFLGFLFLRLGLTTLWFTLWWAQMNKKKTSTSCHIINEYLRKDEVVWAREYHSSILNGIKVSKDTYLNKVFIFGHTKQHFPVRYYYFVSFFFVQSFIFALCSIFYLDSLLYIYFCKRSYCILWLHNSLIENCHQGDYKCNWSFTKFCWLH